MKNTKALNLKNMKETLINYSGLQDEMDKIWDTFHQMACMDFISHDVWMKFFNECSGWVIVGDNVIDAKHDNKVVWVYNPETTYKA